MIWFTSDHHFGHENIIKFLKRPFRDAKEMDTEMVRRWNDVVGVNDTVYHLGDFTLGGISLFNDYAIQLKGHIKIVPGGHDKRWLKDFPGSDYITILPSLYIADDILPKRGEYKVSISMCHYPLLSWEQSHYGSPHLHGHTHGTIGVISKSGDKQLPPGYEEKQGVRIDLSVDNWEFAPISLDRIINIIGVK